MWEYQAQLGRVIDGDTVDVIADTGFRTRYRPRCRLIGIDTAEIHGVSHDSDEYNRGMEHKRFVEEWFSEAFVEHDGSWPLEIETEEDSGKYGRWPAFVWRKCDGEMLNMRLVEEFPEVED